MNSKNAEPLNAENMRKEQRDQYMAIFRMIDVSGDGSLQGNELKQALEKLGENVTDAEIEDIIDEIDEDGNRTIDFKEFLQLVYERGKDYRVIQGATVAFRLFTGNEDSDVMTWNEMQKIIQYFTKGKEKYDLDELMACLPWNDQKELNFSMYLEEFYNQM